MKQLGLLHGYPQPLGSLTQSSVPIYTPGWRETTWSDAPCLNYSNNLPIESPTQRGGMGEQGYFLIKAIKVCAAQKGMFFF